MRIDGRTVVITGAGSGIGQALAQAFASKGARLLLAGRRLEKLEETRASLPAGCECHLVAADITLASGRQRILADATSHFPQLDILINNAGTVLAAPLHECGDEEINRTIATNLTSPICLTRLFLDMLRASPSPKVVNVGSIFGDIGHPLFAAYSASKHGLRGFSDSIRRELAPMGIGVIYVAPRAAKTEATSGFEDLISPLGMAVDSPRKVAARILTAVERESRTAYAHGPERLFVAIQRIFPRIIDAALIRKMANKDIKRALEKRSRQLFAPPDH